MMGSYAIVGAHLPIANGAAWSAQYRGSPARSRSCFFGDGTTNIGAFHEALNIAAVWQLPVVFVCENNLYMEYTLDRRRSRRCRVRRPTGPPPMGWSAIVVDGNDVDAVLLAAVDRDRAGPGRRGARRSSRR